MRGNHKTQTWKVENADGSGYIIMTCSTQKVQEYVIEHSIWTGSLLTVYNQNPMRGTHDFLKLGEWLKFGHAEDGHWSKTK